MEIKLTSGKAFAGSRKTTILETLKDNGLYLIASCGGKGVCGKCRVRLIRGNSHIESRGSLREKDLAEHYVLACQTFPLEDILIEIPDASRIVIGDKIAVSKSKNLLEHIHSLEEQLAPAVRRIHLDLDPPTVEDHVSDLRRLTQALEKQGIHTMRFSHGFVTGMSSALRKARWKVSLAYTENFEAIFLSSEKERHKYGIAIDIGTTTVVLYLVNYENGALVDVGMTYNSQMRYGDDVITRIVHATEGGGLHELRQAVMNDVNDLLMPIMEKHAIQTEDVDTCVIAGNTTMTQLFWGLDPASIREEPYIPTLNSYPAWKAGSAHIRINPQAPVYTFPCVGSYVGGDIVAGVLASRMHTRPEISLFMDIGTNGEVVIGNNEWLIAAACSMGPCFEGSGIRHGMRATEGAIEAVTINPSTYEASLGIIGSTSPSGICGSGMIDTISELFYAGVIDQKGKIARDLNTDRISVGEEGPEFSLYRNEFRNIVLTEADIENIVRAKAALFAGITLLLKEVGFSLDNVDRVYIAGGFGNYINVEKAIMLGMLPDMPKEKFSFIGNSSIAGAYLCLLSKTMRQESEAIAEKITYVELSISGGFMDEYMSALFLPHTNIDLFPSVKNVYKKK